MPNILHIDTSADKGLVALARDGKSVAIQETTTARDHASSINMMIDKVMAEGGIALKDLDALAVMGGPGSYTGLRIGLASAKALCYVLEKPLLVDNKLSLLALQSTGNRIGGYQHFASVLPARQKEYFFSLFAASGDCIKQPVHMFADDLLAILKITSGTILLTGVIGEDLSAIDTLGNLDYIENDLVDLDFWCLKAKENFDCHRFVNLASAEPFYLKQVYTHKA